MGEGRGDDRDAVPSPASFGRAVRAFLEVRLLARYGAGLDLRFEAPGSVVARTEGVSASFIKELLRWATLLAAEEAAD